MQQQANLELEMAKSSKVHTNPQIENVNMTSDEKKTLENCQKVQWDDI